MCGGSANQRRAPPTRNGDSERPTSSRPPAPATRTRWPSPPPVGADSAIPCDVPPETTTRWPARAARRWRYPYRCPRATSCTASTVAVERVAPDAEPQPGPDPRPQAYGRQLAPDRRELLVRQVAHPERSDGQAVPAEPLGGAHDLGDLAARRLVERQVQGEALDAVPGQPRRDVPHRRVVQTEPAHRREQLDHDPVPGELVESGGGRDRADEPVVRRRDVGRSLQMGLQHEYVAVVPAAHRGDLTRHPDRDRVSTQPGRLLAQQGQTEAVAVALRNRHQAGYGGSHGVLVRPPPGAVDPQRQCHRRSCAMPDSRGRAR